MWDGGKKKKKKTYQNVFLRMPQPRFGVEKTVDAGSQTGRRRRRRCSRRCLSLLCLIFSIIIITKFQFIN